MSFDDDVEYNYRDRDYVPAGGNLQRINQNSGLSGSGYHNRDLLENTLDIIINNSNSIINAGEKDLQDYALRVPQDTKLAQAQEQEWPKEVNTEPKDYISFNQYKALENVETRGSEYIRNTYETYIQGPHGTNSVDLIDTASAIKTEAINMKNFLKDYMGDVNDSSEYRTLELLQDWAENGLQQTQNLSKIFTQRFENPPTIPTAELGALTPDDARSYQAFFQTKINGINREIKQIKTELKKEHQDTSELFYKKFLGPSLKFRLQAGRTLENNVGRQGFLSIQAQQADQASAANYVSLLSDQIKRNDTFESRMDNLTKRIELRDAHASFVKQIAQTFDIQTSNPFSKVQPTQEEIEGFKSYATKVVADKETTTDFKSGHEMLDGTDDDLAHPQYVLKAGDILTGDLELADGIKIGGMIPGKHRHRGPSVDGTEQIHGEDIIDLVTGSIKRNEHVVTPTGLRHVSNQTVEGTNNTTFINSLIAWEGNPDLTHEVQTIVIKKTAPETVPTEEWVIQELYEPEVTIVAAIATNTEFFTYASATALYDYNYGTDTNTLIAGQEGVYGDFNGVGSAAQFNDIKDIAQDYYGGNIYVIDASRKVKSTSKAGPEAHPEPVTVTTVYSSKYDIRRIDTQGQHYRNTAYVIEGPTETGKDRVVKLSDPDHNDLAEGASFTPTVIPKLSTFSNLIDIAVAANGNIFVLTADKIINYDPANDTIIKTTISDEVAVPTAITCDHRGQVYISYS